MRILWTDNRFQAEISSGELWRDDVESLKAAGFKTDGPPAWIWRTEKIAPLDYLRKNPPKSGLAITELALEKYQFLKTQQDKKKELKKTFEKLKKQTAGEQIAIGQKEYEDPETGIICILVKPTETKFTWKYIPPTPPDMYCFVCGDPVYGFEQPDLCLWCEEKF